MSLVIPINFASIAINLVHQQDPEPWVITWGIDTSAAGGDDFTAVLEAQEDAWVNSFMGYLDSQVSIQSVSGRFGTDGDPLTVEVPGSGVGSSTSDKLPQNCALMIRKFTNLGGRRGKGRFFIPGMISRNEASETGQLVQGVIDSAASGCVALLNGLEVSTGSEPSTPMVLLHNDQGSQPVPPPTVVTALSPDPLLSTQRRRLR